MAKLNTQDMRQLADKLASRRLRFYFILCGILTVVALFGFIYFGLVRFSIYSTTLRGLLIVLLLIWTVPYFVIRNKNRKIRDAADYDDTIVKKEQPTTAGAKKKDNKGKRFVNYFKPRNKLEIGFFAVFVALITFLLIIVILGIASWPLFNAKNYRGLIDVDIEPATKFYEEVEDYATMKVPVVDKAYAKVLGDKKLGDEVGLGSQFRINDYTLIEYNGELYWIGALEHNTFFTWMANNSGTPGYVRINATNPGEVELLQNQKLKYVPSAYFGQNLQRQLYFQSMDKVVDDRVSFEIDDQGTPHYIFSVIKKRVAITNGKDTIGIITLNAVDGKANYYSVENAPRWVDHVYPTEQLNDQLNWWGHYVHGYFNNIFAKKEVMQVTSGYNYIFNNGEFYLYTGMTSTGGDESIVGVVLVNLKTKKNVTLYNTGGITENAAAQSAKGVFQAENYSATYPLLLNYHGYATYLVMLKDKSGYVKQYAFINLFDLTKYGTGPTKEDAERAYQNKTDIDTNNKHENAEIIDIREVVKENNTVYLITAKDKDGVNITENGKLKIFEASIKLSNELAFLTTGSKINFEFTNQYIQKITVL